MRVKYLLLAYYSHPAASMGGVVEYTRDDILSKYINDSAELGGEGRSLARYWQITNPGGAHINQDGLHGGSLFLRHAGRPPEKHAAKLVPANGQMFGMADTT